jgi:hypothetical protein
MSEIMNKLSKTIVGGAVGDPCEINGKAGTMVSTADGEVCEEIIDVTPGEGSGEAANGGRRRRRSAKKSRRSVKKARRSAKKSRRSNKRRGGSAHKSL